MKKQILFGLLIIMLFASCVAHEHHDINLNPDEYIIYGFWSGLWHGLISPITFIISLFSDSVTVWETHNNGAWYAFGFLLGAGSTIGGSTKASK